MFALLLFSFLDGEIDLSEPMGCHGPGSQVKSLKFRYFKQGFAITFISLCEETHVHEKFCRLTVVQLSRTRVRKLLAFWKPRIM